VLLIRQPARQKKPWGNVKDAAKQIHDSHKQEADDRANEARRNIKGRVEKTKETLNEKIKDFKQRHSA
jgi:uncharacterized protein YjbJ (UPF0337 family)